MSSVVALESTVFAHGLPHPVGVETALALESTVRTNGGTPRTIGIVDGEIHVGLEKSQIRRLGTAEDVRKVSLRDLPIVTARSRDGATTVAATMTLAHRAGIDVAATGGIGGVHRSPEADGGWDVSADLEALRRIPMAVVCSGPKLILDLSATRERLETVGVPVVGYGTDEMPAFYSPSSTLPVDVRCDTPKEVAELLRERDRLGLPSAVLVTVPPPADAALSREHLTPIVEQALSEAADRDLRAAAVTPFLLRRLREIDGSRIVEANRALLHRNASVAARIAKTLE